MGESIHVSSIQTILEFRAYLIKFTEEIRGALDAAEMEVRRTRNWLQRDQLMHWQSEYKRRTLKLNEAKSDLFRRKIASEGGLSTVVQKEAIREATAGLREAEAKLALLKKWAVPFERAVNDYQGRGRTLRDLIDQDLEKALAQLERMAQALEAYRAVTAPKAPRPESDSASAAATSTPVGGTTSTMSRGAAEKEAPTAQDKTPTADSHPAQPTAPPQDQDP